MKVLVPVKHVVDPYVKIFVKKDESGVDSANAKHTMNPFDEIAMEQAAQWQQAQLTDEVLVVSIGAQSVTQTLRAGLARGADRALHINTPDTLSPLVIAKLLTKVAQDEKVDVILMGKQAIDDDCNQTGQMLSALLGWPGATFVSAITLEEDKTLLCTREVDGGLQTLKLTLPAVITCDLRLNEPRHIALPNIMKAKRKPIDEKQATDYGIDLSSKVKTLKVSAPADRPPGVLVKDVDTLLSLLKEKEKLLS